MRRTAVLVLSFLILDASSVVPSGQTTPDAYYQAVRNHDLSALRTLVRERGVDATDAQGQTPLMLAAAFGSVDAVRLLLAHGADAKAASSTGVTALHLAATEMAKVRALVDAGAGVNAVSQQGRTPLLIAASANDTADVLRLLIDKGANVNAADSSGVTPLIAAARIDNRVGASLLLERGADADANANLESASTPLMAAAWNGNEELVRTLLTRNVDVGAVSGAGRKAKNGPILFGRITALHVAVNGDTPSIVGRLLDAGAAIDPLDVRGTTPLTWAVASDRPNVAIVRLLLARGADPQRRSVTGESPRDWSLKFRHPEIVSAMGVTLPAASAPEPTAIAGPVSPRTSVERALPLLRLASGKMLPDGGCVACHAQPLTGMAVSRARARGWTTAGVDNEVAQTTITLASHTARLLQLGEGPGEPDTLLYYAALMAAESATATQATDALVRYLMTKQRADGRWRGVGGQQRAPITDGDFSRTALSIRVLTAFATPSRAAELTARVQRAAAWLAAQTPISTEDRVMQLLGLHWAGASPRVRQQRLGELLALQRADGGWAQTPHLPSDAYATGEVLYVSRELGVAAAEPALQRGATFLMRTQQGDGTWPVKSRALKLQPYFESGFPYGHDQWISHAGTAWAVMALASLSDEASTAQTAPAGSRSELIAVTSKDGTRIGVECAGTGPTLLFVHGGVGGRTRWTPMFPLLASKFTVCAMDRRGRGASGDSAEYSLLKEAEDVAAVVNSRAGPVFVFGHSLGGVAALEAAFLTDRITKLMLYEPPLHEPFDNNLFIAVAARIDEMVRNGELEEALVAFQTEIVKQSPEEVARMKTRPTWPGLVASMAMHPRQMRALAAYRFDASRMKSVRMPTLLLIGEDTASPYAGQSIAALRKSLPNPTLVVLERQEHNAMEGGRELLANAIITFAETQQAYLAH